MSKLKRALPEEYFDLVEAFEEGGVTPEEFDRLQKAYLREAFLKVVA